MGMIEVECDKCRKRYVVKIRVADNSRQRATTTTRACMDHISEMIQEVVEHWLPKTPK